MIIRGFNFEWTCSQASTQEITLLMFLIFLFVAYLIIDLIQLERSRKQMKKHFDRFVELTNEIEKDMVKKEKSK